MQSPLECLRLLNVLLSSTKTKRQSIPVVGGITTRDEKEKKGEISSDFTGLFSEDSARLGYNSRLSSQRFDSFIDYNSEDQSMTEGGFKEYLDSPPHRGDYVAPPPPAEVVSEGSEFVGKGPILPPPAEEGFALGEWRRLVRYML